MRHIANTDQAEAWNGHRPDNTASRPQGGVWLRRGVDLSAPTLARARHRLRGTWWVVSATKRELAADLSRSGDPALRGNCFSEVGIATDYDELGPALV